MLNLPFEPSSAESALTALAKLSSEMKTKLKAADHDRELEEFAVDAVEQILRLRRDPSALSLIAAPSQHRLDYLTALAWSAEVMEYFGRLSEKSDTYTLVKSEGPAIYAGLIGRSAPVGSLEMRIAREEIWVALSWARGLYRIHKYGEALRVVERCEDFVETKLLRKGFECHLTLASLWSLHAKVLRQLVNLQGAKIYYDRALSRIYERLQYGADARVNCEVARILAFGHGWILYTQGLLEEARAAVSTALVVLHKTNDVIYRAYGEMLLCSVSRARIGTDPDKIDPQVGIDQPTLTRVIETTQKQYEVFKEYGHEPYAARAAYELALSYLNRGLSPGTDAREDFTKAAEKLNEVLGLDDSRWQANAWVVMSRVQRAQGDLGPDRAVAWNKAEASAAEALKIANEANLDFCKIDAHIALGEVCAGRPNADDRSLRTALEHFKEALVLAIKNPKPSAVCHLHMAKVHLRRGNLRDAQLELAEWQKVEHKIQHGFIRAFGLEVAAAVRQAEQEYFIVDTKASLNIEQHTNQLLRFLLTQARARYADNAEERYRQLGIKRATYYNLWRRLGEAPLTSDAESGHLSQSASSGSR